MKRKSWKIVILCESVYVSLREENYFGTVCVTNTSINLPFLNYYWVSSFVLYSTQFPHFGAHRENSQVTFAMCSLAVCVSLRVIIKYVYTWKRYGNAFGFLLLSYIIKCASIFIHKKLTLETLYTRCHHSTRLGFCFVFLWLNN